MGHIFSNMPFLPFKLLAVEQILPYNHQKRERRLNAFVKKELTKHVTILFHLPRFLSWWVMGRHTQAPL